LEFGAYKGVVTRLFINFDVMIVHEYGNTRYMTFLEKLKVRHPRNIKRR